MCAWFDPIFTFNCIKISGLKPQLFYSEWVWLDFYHWKQKNWFNLLSITQIISIQRTKCINLIQINALEMIISDRDSRLPTQKWWWTTEKTWRKKKKNTGIKSCCCCADQFIKQWKLGMPIRLALRSVITRMHSVVTKGSEWIQSANPKKNIILSLLQSFANVNGTKVISVYISLFLFLV